MYLHLLFYLLQCPIWGDYWVRRTRLGDFKVLLLPISEPLSLLKAMSSSFLNPDGAWLCCKIWVSLKAADSGSATCFPGLPC
jgi:hypothetical protein